METADEQLTLVEADIEDARSNMEKFEQKYAEILEILDGEREPENEFEESMKAHKGQPLVQQIRQFRNQLRKALSSRADVVNKIQSMKKSKI